MKSLFFFLASVWLAADTVRAATNDEVAAKKVAYDIAGAFTNDGFKMRDGSWLGKIEAKKSLVLQVNLYAGNQYWFSCGATEGAKKMSVTIYDEAGKPLAADLFSEDGRAACGYAASASGSYYIKVEEVEGTAATFCLLYSYK